MKQANTTSEEELDEILAKHGAEAGELTASLKDALLAWRDAAVVEARVDELENLRQDWHSLYTVHKEVDERLDELTKAKGEA